jgi:hypothetical protein
MFICIYLLYFRESLSYIYGQKLLEGNENAYYVTANLSEF